MAPKGTKRASVGSAPAGKRQMLKKKSDLVVEALGDADYPEAVSAALISAAPSCLKEYKENRHPFQVSIIEMVSTALDGVEAAVKSELQESQTKVDGIEAEKVTRDNNKTAAEAALEAKKSAVTAAQEALKTAQAEETAAAKDLKTAQKHAADYEKEFKTAHKTLDAAKDVLSTFHEGPKAGFDYLKDRETPPPEPELPYYEVLDGYKCDRAIVAACREAVAGQGDGRVSVKDAKDVFEVMKDGNKVTRCERWTARYCMTEFKWTEAALKWIHEANKKVKQDKEDKAEEDDEAFDEKKHKSYYETIDGLKCDRGIIDACKTAMGGQGDGRISVADAEKIFAKVADGGTITCAERWTVRYCLTKFHWTEAGHDWFMAELKKGTHTD